MGLKRWHFFLSHTQRNGDAKSVALELFFGFSEQGKKIWLDVKMPKMDMVAMKDGVNGSRCVLGRHHPNPNPNPNHITLTFTLTLTLTLTLTPTLTLTLTLTLT
jgi:hypothetical protein